jgi:hypothetical protein
MGELTGEHGTTGLVEEILEQQSAQALKLAHIDEGLEDIKRHLQRVGEAVAVRAREPSEDRHNTGTIDLVERDTQALKSRVGWLLGFVVIQTLLVIALLIFAMKPMARGSELVPAGASGERVEPAPILIMPTADKPVENPFAGAPGAPSVSGTESVTHDDKPPVETKSKKKRRK